MAGQSDTSQTSAGYAERSDDERLLDESVVEVGPEPPLDAPLEVPIADALDQQRPVPLDDEEHDPS